MSYVVVPAERLFRFLEAKGFSRTVRFREVVYVREHHLDPRYKVLVYTSVREGAAEARKRGADAIRVCAIFEDQKKAVSRGVAKLPKVLRTGTVEAVLERTIERAREAYRIINQKVKHGKRITSFMSKG